MWVGLYYILSHESTYCKPTPLFCAEVRALAHRLIIRTLRYQQRSMESFADFHTFPAHVAKPLVNAGEWTASLTGRPHHNVALDEAHEMVINRRLKQITSRASHFRTVELADFMAYLEVQGAWDRFLSRSKKDSEASTLKRYACQRVECIQTILEGLTVPLFRYSSDPSPLRNVFVASAAKLPLKHCSNTVRQG